MTLSKQDLLRALGSTEFMSGELISSQPDEEDPVETKSTHPEQSFDIESLNALFKKSERLSEMGVLKVKFLGNALKDYQLIRPSDEAPTIVSGGCTVPAPSKIKNQPSAVYLRKAMLALVESWIVFCALCLKILTKKYHLSCYHVVM